MENSDKNLNTPIACKLQAGDHYWCACGHSDAQPFCNGSHKTASPGISPLKFTLESDKEVWLCQCKKTTTPPYCDGTHKSL